MKKLGFNYSTFKKQFTSKNRKVTQKEFSIRTLFITLCFVLSSILFLNTKTITFIKNKL